MSEALPRFLSASFDFENSAKVPKHIEEIPQDLNTLGMYALLGVTREQKTYILAADIPNYAAAIELTEARIRLQHKTLGLYGYSDQLDLRYPDNSYERLYDAIAQAE